MNSSTRGSSREHFRLERLRNQQPDFRIIVVKDWYAQSLVLHGGASRVECRAYSGGIGSRRAESWMQCVLQATYTQDAQVTYMLVQQLMKKRGHDFVKKKKNQKAYKERF